jgi:RNA-binding protein
VRRVGEVVRAAQGVAVVRSPDDSHPEVGTTVVDESLADVGEVVAVFGPVERPYAAVSPTGRAASLVGEVLYARE